MAVDKSDPSAIWAINNQRAELRCENCNHQHLVNANVRSNACTAHKCDCAMFIETNGVKAEPLRYHVKRIAEAIWDAQYRTDHVVSYDDAVEIRNRGTENSVERLAALERTENLAVALDEKGFGFSDYKSIVAVLATESEAGHRYAESIGLRDYEVYTEETAERMQGLRIRAVVMTPGYIAQSEKAAWDAQKARGIAEQSQSLMRGPRG